MAGFRFQLVNKSGLKKFFYVKKYINYHDLMDDVELFLGGKCSADNYVKSMGDFLGLYEHREYFAGESRIYFISEDRKALSWIAPYFVIDGFFAKKHNYDKASFKAFVNLRLNDIKTSCGWMDFRDELYNIGDLCRSYNYYCINQAESLDAFIDQIYKEASESRLVKPNFTYDSLKKEVYEKCDFIGGAVFLKGSVSVKA